MTRAAKQLIERYLYELKPHFEGSANWTIIFKIERRFGLVGYGEMLEKKFRQDIAKRELARCRQNYAITMDSDSHAFLRDAEAQFLRLA